MRKVYTAFIISVVSFLAASCADRNGRPEISWSLMHPTHLDTTYMAKMIEKSLDHPVDNFEICGACNSFTDGSLDGLILFEEYPLAHAAQNLDIVEHNRESIKRIVEMAHEIGKPVYLWHRDASNPPNRMIR